MSLFTGLSAFPLTPFSDDAVDEASFIGLIERLATAGVDSITALGSTGSYAYLTVEERARVARLAVEHARSTPVFVGVGALRTSHILANIDSAQEAGATGVLLAPMTYQPQFGGSLRVVAAIAEHLGLAPRRCLPLPIQGLTDAQRTRATEVVEGLLTSAW